MKRTPGFTDPLEEEITEARNEPSPAEPEDSPELVQAVAKKTRPKREQAFIDYWVAKRDKAITTRDNADAEVKGANAVLSAVGWPE